MRSRDLPTSDQHVKAALSLLRQHARRSDPYRLFSDTMELTAISIANSVDLRQFEPREARYLEIVRHYDPATITFFPRFFAEITLALEAWPDDVLGAVFTALEIHNANRGQSFTPYPVCRMMAATTLGDAAAAQVLIDQKGFLTAMEPACGSGAMVIALTEALRAAGINYQRHLHVTAVDVDPSAVHMAYIQFSLLHIPAEVRVGNSLSGEVHERWYTPAHIMGGWSHRLACRSEPLPAAASVATAPPKPPPRPHATGAAFQLSLF